MPPRRGSGALACGSVPAGLRGPPRGSRGARPNRDGAAANASTTKPAPGCAEILATYESHEGRRRLVAQRINGKVAVSDVPARDQRKVYLVERHVGSMAELEALVADYCRLATKLRPPPMAADWICR